MRFDEIIQEIAEEFEALDSGNELIFKTQAQQVLQEHSHQMRELDLQQLEERTQQQRWDRVVAMAGGRVKAQAEQITNYAQENNLSGVAEAIAEFQQACKEAEIRGFLG